jgi:hypothetical protein
MIVFYSFNFLNFPLNLRQLPNLGDYITFPIQIGLKI